MSKTMHWKPVHEAHAIERVRILVQFASPLTEKLMRRATSVAVEAFKDLGFDQLKRAESSIQNVALNLALGTAAPQKTQTGWVLQRTVSGQLREEAGFRDGVFGYVSLDYGRWDNLNRRFWDIFAHALNVALESADINSVKLEYWDRFVYMGDPNEADANLLLSNVNSIIPTRSAIGKSSWHSHAGWFEDHTSGPILVNINFDASDIDAQGETRRSCGIYTMVELRPQIATDSVADLKSALGYLHNRSLTLFGEALNDEFRNAIGIRLEDYL